MACAMQTNEDENINCRERKPNFSRAEIRVILEGVSEHKHVLLDYYSSSSSRNAIFKQITVRVNEVAKKEFEGKVQRDWKQVRKKWTNLKLASLKHHRAKLKEGQVVHDVETASEENPSFTQQVLDIISSENESNQEPVNSTDDNAAVYDKISGTSSDSEDSKDDTQSDRVPLHCTRAIKQEKSDSVTRDEVNRAQSVDERMHFKVEHVAASGYVDPVPMTCNSSTQQRVHLEESGHNVRLPPKGVFEESSPPRHFSNAEDTCLLTGVPKHSTTHPTDQHTVGRTDELEQNHWQTMLNKSSISGTEEKTRQTEGQHCAFSEPQTHTFIKTEANLSPPHTREIRNCQVTTISVDITSSDSVRLVNTDDNVHLQDSGNAETPLIHFKSESRHSVKQQENTTPSRRKIRCDVPDADSDVFQSGKKTSKFTKKELDIMLTLYEANSRILHSKKRDADTVVMKRQVFEHMVNQLNASGMGHKGRTVHHVRNKLKNLRSEVLRWRRRCKESGDCGLEEVGEMTVHSLDQPLLDRLLRTMAREEDDLREEEAASCEAEGTEKKGEQISPVGEQISQNSPVIQKHLDSLIDICRRLRTLGVEAGAAVFQDNNVLCCGSSRLKRVVTHPLLSSILSEVPTTVGQNGQSGEQWTVSMLPASCPDPAARPLSSPDHQEGRSALNTPADRRDSQQASEHSRSPNPSVAAVSVSVEKQNSDELSAEVTGSHTEVTFCEPLTLTCDRDDDGEGSVLEEGEEAVNKENLLRQVLSALGDDVVGSGDSQSADMTGSDRKTVISERSRSRPDAEETPSKSNLQEKAASRETTLGGGVVHQQSGFPLTLTAAASVASAYKAHPATSNQLSSSVQPSLQGCGGSNTEAEAEPLVERKDYMLADGHAQQGRETEGGSVVDMKCPVVLLKQLPARVVDGVLFNLSDPLKETMTSRPVVNAQTDPCVCQLCGKRFATPFKCRRHVLSHSRERPYHCDQCPMSFKRKQNLKTHKLRHGERRHACDICGRRFFTAFETVGHKRKAHRPKALPDPCVCQYCDERFATALLCKEHAHCHTGERPYTCNQCPMAFKRKRVLTIHKMRHGEPTLACDFCGRRFTTADDRRSHLKRVHGPKPDDRPVCGKPFRCDQCPKAFASKHLLKNHKARHGERTIACDVCGRLYAFIKDMHLHKKRRHGWKPKKKERTAETPGGGGGHSNSGGTDDAVTRTGEDVNAESQQPGRQDASQEAGARLYRCDQCPKAYNDKGTLQKHKLRHGERAHACDICGRRYFTRFETVAHKRKCLLQKAREGMDTGPDPHVCQFCGRRYPTPFLCREHTRCHTGERPYRCDQCPMAFARKRILMIHKKRHGERTVPCDVCGRRFTFAGDMQAHRKRRHEPTVDKVDKVFKELFEWTAEPPGGGGESNSGDTDSAVTTTAAGGRPFKCDQCPKAFTSKRLLKQHKRRHGEPFLPCHVCGRRFICTSDLNVHVKKVHRRKVEKTAASEPVERTADTSAVTGGEIDSSDTHSVVVKTETCVDSGETTTGNTDSPATTEMSAVNGGEMNLGNTDSLVTTTTSAGGEMKSCNTGSPIKTETSAVGGEMSSSDTDSPIKAETSVVGGEMNGLVLSTSAGLNMGPLLPVWRLKKRNPYECQDCGMVHPDQASLERHQVAHVGRSALDCIICGKRFLKKAYLKIHVKRHQSTVEYQCEVCGAKFKEKWNLKMHMRSHTGEKPYRCEHCGQNFGNQTHLNVHRRSHTGERPYLCDFCGASFNQAGKLNYHRRIHTGEKPYRCEDCGASFRGPRDLRIHRRQHTGIEPYTCPICGQVFRYSSHRNTHVRLHTGERPYGCEVCGQRFHRTDALRKHMKRHAFDTPSNLESPSPSGREVVPASQEGC
ncbi:uncharacterized protein LOC143277343 [Babylonia areolata]|uniref:uncharacterized protein LOC143277343 n=1 Tax=Babylonia areolata TaxID=304850 RepID=UPI003FCFDF3F